MRVPAAVIYLILGGLVALAWVDQQAAAGVLAAIAGSTALLMLAAGFHPLFGVFYLLSCPANRQDK